VVLDTETSRVALDDAIFGWQYAMNDYRCPFVLMATGNVDFGDDSDSTEAKCNVRDVVLAIDSVIRWTGNGYDQTFRVIELHDMLVRAK
jgi:hypothetical protein